jgi:hypothetical protein
MTPKSYLDSHPMPPAQWLRRAGKIEERMKRLSKELSELSKEYAYVLGHLAAFGPPPRRPSKQAMARIERPMLPLIAYFDPIAYGLDQPTVVKRDTDAGRRAAIADLVRLSKLSWRLN